jgi:hypothetical protein
MRARCRLAFLAPALMLFIGHPSCVADATIIDLPTGPPPGPHIGTPAGPAQRSAEHIQVGSSRAIKTPSEAAAIAQTGDIIEIDAEPYVGDVAVWRADNLTIRGVPLAADQGGDGARDSRAKLFAAGRNAEGKAIWVIKGRNAVVENIEFANAEVPAGNGAGIRAEGPNLKVVNCYFHDNQEGILSSMYVLDSTIEIENSEFARDGGNGGQSHEIYINNLRQLIVWGSYFHSGNIGHLIKSRAQRNLIIANRITDEAGGGASYEIEFPNGGFNVVAGNLIEQSASTQNSTILANALEGATNTEQELYVVNNTFANDLGRGDFIRARAPSIVWAINNIFIGGGNVLIGDGHLRNNLLTAGVGGAPSTEQPLFQAGKLDERGTRTAVDAGLLDRDHYDYRLGPDSPAIGWGVDPGLAERVRLFPTLEYVHPAQTKAVTIDGRIDVGAYQHGQ